MYESSMMKHRSRENRKKSFTGLPRLNRSQSISKTVHLKYEHNALAQKKALSTQMEDKTEMHVNKMSLQDTTKPQWRELLW